MIVCRYGYDGTGFEGFTREAGRRTVEGRIIEVFAEVGALEGGEPPAHASRTDRGVSALGNVLSYRPAHEPARTGDILRGVNALLSGDGVQLTGFIEVDDGFDVRRADRRTYVYFIFQGDMGLDPRSAGGSQDGAPGRPAALDLLDEALGLFEGEHDFALFSKRDRSRDVPTVRTIDLCRVYTMDALFEAPGSAEVEPAGFAPAPMAGIVVSSRGFLWNQVRRMVGSAMECARGRLGLEEIRDALNGGPEGEGNVPERMGPAAPAHPLILWDVAYEPPLTYGHLYGDGQGSNILKALGGEWRMAWVRMNVLGTLMREVDGSQ